MKIWILLPHENMDTTARKIWKWKQTGTCIECNFGGGNKDWGTLFRTNHLRRIHGKFYQLIPIQNYDVSRTADACFFLGTVTLGFPRVWNQFCFFYISEEASQLPCKQKTLRSCDLRTYWEILRYKILNKKYGRCFFIDLVYKITLMTIITICVLVFLVDII